MNVLIPVGNMLKGLIRMHSKVLGRLILILALALCSFPCSVFAQPAPTWTWIWAQDSAPAPDTLYLRESFRLASAPASALLFITADEDFAAFINGDRKPAAQGSDWTTVQEVNVTHLLAKGQNLLAIRAMSAGGLAGVLFRLQITMPNGKSFMLHSCSRVKVTRRPPPGWVDLKYSDANWLAAHELAPANAQPWGPLHGALVNDPAHLVRLWDIRAGLPPDQSPYVSKRIVGDRMLLATSVTSVSDMRLLNRAGFSLFQTDSNHISTEQDAPGHWNWTLASASGHSVNGIGLDWCYAPHNAFPPEWYRMSVPFTRIQCVEHHQPVQAFSPWDPSWVAFVSASYDAIAKQFPAENDDHGKEKAKRPNNSQVSALYVGIHGDYGEAGLLTGGRVLVPSQRAAWEKQFGDTHDHLGWWCDDALARKAFQTAMVAKYGDISHLNIAWKRSFKAPDEIAFPLPTGIRPEAKREWLDFVEWYQAGVGQAVETNLSAARQRFPKTLLMLPVGFSDENPRGGNDNSLLPKLAAKFSADVRSTHGGFRPFAENSATMFGRIASACRYYGVPFWSEPPGPLTPEQEVGRIFEDISQGAKGHFEWSENALSNIDVFYKYGKLMRVEKPIVDVAMFYPAEAQRLRPDQGYNQLFAQACTYMRDVANYDIVDDRMVLDDCLSHYRVLALWEGTQADQKTLDRIRNWVNAGGTLLAYDFGKVSTFEGDTGWWNDMFGYSRTLSPAVLKEYYTGVIPSQYRIITGDPSASEYLSDDGWEKPDMPTTVDGVASRWTNKPTASLRVPVKQGINYSLIIRALAPPESAGLNRTVMVNGRVIGQLSQTGEVTYRFVLPSTIFQDRPLTSISFQCELFTPATPIPNHSDAKSLGLLIHSVQLVEQGQTPTLEPPSLPGQIRHELDLVRLRNEWAQLKGKGMTIFFPAQKRLLKGYMEVVRRAIYHLTDIDPASGRRDALPVDDANDGIYATLFSNKILYYNPKDTRVTKKVVLPPATLEAWKDEIETPREHSWMLTLEPHSIQPIYLSAEPQEMLFECEKFTDISAGKPVANANCSPGAGINCITLPKGAQISTHISIDDDAAGTYTVFTRCITGQKPQSVDILIDGQAISAIDAQAGGTLLAGSVKLAAGQHTLSIRNRSQINIDADYVVLTNDRTVAGYNFAAHFASVE